jgi:tRNA 2-thiouridine synthesizing protein C
MPSKRILFLLRHAPYATSNALEALEAALVAGVFDQRVSVLFADEGVWQLLVDQNGDSLSTRTVSRVVSVLPEYEIDAVYACRDSLERHGLTSDDLVLPVRILDFAEQQALIGRHDAVLND